VTGGSFTVNAACNLCVGVSSAAGAWANVSVVLTIVGGLLARGKMLTSKIEAMEVTAARFDAANARVDKEVAEAEEKIRSSVASGQDPDAAVKAASLRGPQPSPRGVVVLAKATASARSTQKCVCRKRR